MNIYNSHQWLDDVDAVVETIPDLSSLSGKSIMITGAAGLICSAIVDILFAYNDKHHASPQIQIIAAGRWPEEMENRFAERVNRSDFQFVVYDASKLDNCLPTNVCPDYIIHAASNAYSTMIMQEPVETILSNVIGAFEMLNLAKSHKTRRLLYVSSSEVYGRKSDTEQYRETEYGYIDLLNPRNSYSIGKRTAENMCVSYASEYGVDSVIVRPGHIYGPTASPNDTRASSSFAWAAGTGKNIIMNSEGTQIRSHCHCLDCATAMLKVLIRGRSGHAYNISNPKSITSIKEMAEYFATSGGVELIMRSATDEEKASYNPMSNSSLDSSSLEALGWEGYFGVDGFAHTVRVIQEMNKETR